MNLDISSEDYYDAEYLEEKGIITMKYKAQLIKYRVRVSLKNELFDNRKFYLRSLDINRKLFTSIQWKRLECGQGWDMKYEDYFDDSFFKKVKILHPDKYEKNGDVIFINNNEYLELANGDEITLDLLFQIKDREFKFICTVSECEECYQSSLAEYFLDELELLMSFDPINSSIDTSSSSSETHRQAIKLGIQHIVER
ncbi:hypothetical protein [Chondrinema litorale]|uniref:hypothetical protein n=1 Tax=Chondrinema litorale TaxID=2994555 RepID=UPI0025433E56|nr:hypothetical protein [Chondrinema litorale]UZS00085.1 hypothetical protein OQ292_39790 [Chondrinema litorale]